MNHDVAVQGPDETADCWHCEGRGETGFAHTGFATCAHCEGTGATTVENRLAMQELVAWAEGHAGDCAWRIVDGKEVCVGR